MQNSTPFQAPAQCRQFGRDLTSFVLCAIVTALLAVGAVAQIASTPRGAEAGSFLHQQQAPGETERALPDIAVLMHQVEAHQRQSEALLKDYIYKSVETAEQSDGHDGVKKRALREYDVFWLQGVPVRKLVAKEGKPLDPDELRKEDERIDKEVAKAKERRERNENKGKQTDPMGHEEVTVSRILELGTFSNARWEVLDGRPTIAVEYAGDPKAKTRNRAEDVVRDLVGTVWVDEEDKTIVKAQGRFVNTFKIGAGLVANIRKGTSFAMEQRKINGEAWLPTVIEAHGAGRAMLIYSFDGSIRVVDSDFRKFKASSTILPGISTVEEPDPH